MQGSITGCLNIAMEYLRYGYNEDLRCIFAAFIISTGCWPNEELKDGCIKTKSQRAVNALLQNNVHRPSVSTIWVNNAIAWLAS